MRLFVCVCVCILIIIINMCKVVNYSLCAQLTIVSW